MKKCCICKEEKTKLHIHTRSTSGHIFFSCRECKAKMSKKYREKNRAKFNKTSYAYQRKNYNLAKTRARVLLRVAVETGKIITPKKCSVCGKSKKVEGHHKDYNLPLDVTWLCRGCHADQHILEKTTK